MSSQQDLLADFVWLDAVLADYVCLDKQKVSGLTDAVHLNIQQAEVWRGENMTGLDEKSMI